MNGKETISIFNVRTGKTEEVHPVVKTDAEWRPLLTPEQYDVARKQGTEYAFTGKYHASKEHGTYTCACCGTDLFSSVAKFDSGTGWPRFSAPVSAPTQILPAGCNAPKCSAPGAGHILATSLTMVLPLRANVTA